MKMGLDALSNGSIPGETMHGRAVTELAIDLFYIVTIGQLPEECLCTLSSDVCILYILS